MQATFGQAFRLMNRRSRSGQSIILVALAFILLIAFVGIAVDVAMMFVRYNSLRRAVDSAAIAVAGQVREGVSFTTLNSVAQQFINLQGNASFDLNAVLVETCETDVANYVLAVHKYVPASVGAGWPGGGQSAVYDLLKTLPSSISPSPYFGLLNTALIGRTAPDPSSWSKSELCQLDPEKLVRVSAELDSPTTFLSLLGWKHVVLVTSSVSQTAVLDVALAIDTSLSMAYDTKDAEAANTAGVYQYPCLPDCNTGGNEVSLRNFAPFTNGYNSANPPAPSESGLGLLPYNPASTQADQGIDTGSPGPNNGAIRTECSVDRRGQTSVNGVTGAKSANYAWAGCCNDPILQSYPAGSPGNHAPGGTASTNNAIWSFANNIDPNYWLADDPSFSQSLIQTGTNPNYTWPAGSITSGTVAKATLVSGAGDPFNYSSLICEPFKQVRDAARHFLYRLDFTRGDRVALIDFNSTATALAPLDNPGQNIILDKNTAIRTLNFESGVEVNHIWTNDATLPPDMGNQQGIFGCNGFFYSGAVYHNPNNVNQYFERSQCPDTNTGGGIRLARVTLTDARWVRREAVWVIVMLSDGYPNRTNPYIDPNTPIDSINIGGGAVEQKLTGIPPLPYTDSSAAYPNKDDMQIVAPYTYNDYCVTVGGPVYGTKPQLCNGWGTTQVAINPVTGVATQPVNGSNLTSFGFCPRYTYCDPSSGTGYCASSTWNSPYGAVTIPAQDYKPSWWTDPALNWPGRQNSFPTTCMTVDPDARHFCMNRAGVIGPNENAASGSPIYDSQAVSSDECDPRYDGVDFARDEADFAGLLTYVQSTGGVGGSQTVPGNFISMFSIMFSHSTAGTTPNIGLNILGVKMMRYIADAGDNGIIDNGLQAWYRANRWVQPTVANGVLQTGAGADVQGGGTGPVYNNWTNPANSVVTSLTGTDPCATYDYVNMTPSPLGGSGAYEGAATADCGQYFFATNIAKVNTAFTVIAGKLFTRLSR